MTQGGGRNLPKMHSDSPRHVTLSAHFIFAKSLFFVVLVLNGKFSSFTNTTG